MEKIYRFAHWIAVLLYAIHSQAQHKQKLTPEQYSLWHQLSTGPVANDGSWVSYTMLYPGGKDTLYLKNTETGFKYSFPSGNNGTISPDDNYFAYQRKDTLHLLELSTGKSQYFPGVSSYSFPKGQKCIVYAGGTPKKALYISPLDGQVPTIIANVEEYALNPSGSQMAFIVSWEGQQQVCVIRLSIF